MDAAERRVEFAFGLRRLAEAWWGLADTLETGADRETLRAQLIALEGQTIEAVSALDAAL